MRNVNVPKVNVPKVNLNVNLQAVNVPNVNLPNVNLSNVNLPGVNLNMDLKNLNVLDGFMCMRGSEADDIMRELPADLLDSVRKELTRNSISKRFNGADAVTEAVRYAAETGHIRLLRLLKQSGAWKPEQSAFALQVAEEAGFLTKLLQYFQMPLENFPAMAQVHERDAAAVLGSPYGSALSEQPQQDAILERVGGLRAPSTQASLLANYLLVPSSAAEDVLKAAIEQMVVFHPLQEWREDAASKMDFPKTLGPLYISRAMDEKKAATLRYDKAKQTLVRHNGKTVYRTSAEIPLTLTDSCLDAALVPPSAEAYVYVHGGEGSVLGSYLYLGAQREPIGMNTISWEIMPALNMATHMVGVGAVGGAIGGASAGLGGVLQAQQAMLMQQTKLTFGFPTFLDAESSQELAELSQDVKHRQLTKAGAKTFLWLGPDHELAEELSIGAFGGFVYFRENAPAIYFPIISAVKPTGHVVKLMSRLANLHSVPAAMSFPETLGAIFLRRELIVQADDHRVMYDRGRRELRLQFDRVGSILNTSEEYPLSLKRLERRAALIPMQATHFCYIFYGDGFDTGGFLYISEKDGVARPLAVNSISFEHRRHALAFGAYQPLPVEGSRRLKKRAQKTSVGPIQDVGATHYAWVGPNEELPGGFKCATGGFAYLFEDSSMDRFFPLIGAAEVVDRAVLPAELGCAMLSADAKGLDVERCWAPERSAKSAVQTGWRAILKPILGQSVRNEGGGGVPVNVARLRVPDPTHPVVLHGLAYTTRRQVLDTIAAKAITQVAFDQARFDVVRDIVLELVSLGAITRIAKSVRSGDLLDDYGDGVWKAYTRGVIICCFAAIVAVFVKNLIDEIFLMTGYYRRVWSWDYVSYQKAMKWIHLGLLGVMIVWVSLGLGLGFTSIPVGVRPLIAAVGCMKWVMVLYMCRGFQVFRMGPRILPIFAALTEVGDFVLITMFFAFSCAHAAYSLSTDAVPYEYIIFSVYRLGFLGDFDMQKDVLYLQEGEEPLPWQEFQYGSFVIFSFLISIAMTNIFIGVMSNAFDYHQERVTELFVRSRACMGLDHALGLEGMYYWKAVILCRHRRAKRADSKRCCRWWPCCRRRRRDPTHNILWICYPKHDEDDASDITIRGALNSVRGDLREQLLQLITDVGHISARMTGIEEKLGCAPAGGPALAAADVRPGSRMSGGPTMPRPQSPSGGSTSVNVELLSARTVHSVMSPHASAASVFEGVRAENLMKSYRPMVPLKVVIVSAAGLRKADRGWFSGTSDPYCRCEIVGKEYSRVCTGVASETCDPVWNFECILESFQEGDTLKFTVSDEDLGKDDDVLGHVIIHEDFVYPFSQTVPLAKTGEKKSKATLTLEISRYQRDEDHEAKQAESDVSMGAAFGAIVAEVGNVLSTVLPGAPSEDEDRPLPLLPGQQAKERQAKTSCSTTTGQGK